jgi:hypothetical protein
MKISRRHVLRGLGGAAISLPILEGLRPRDAEAADDVPSFAVFFRQASRKRQLADLETYNARLTTIGQIADNPDKTS